MPRRRTIHAPAPAAPREPSAARRHALVLLALWAVALLAYSNSFHTAVIGDARLIATDPRITAAASENLRQIAGRDYWLNRGAGLYRPFATLSYLVNYAVLENGMRPPGYHAVSFALHAANIGMVYVLGLALAGGIVPAAMMAALWGVHPVLTESVTNLAGRPDLLAAFGVLAGLVCHRRARNAAGPGKALWLSALAVAAAAGFFSKENAAVLPAVMALWDVAFRPKRWRAALPGYAVVLAVLGAFLLARHAVLGAMPAMQIPFTDNPIAGADFWTARLTAVKVIGLDLWLLLWPARLSCDYSFNQIPLANWTEPAALLSLAACVALAIAAVLSLRRHPAFFFLAGFFAVTLLPTSNLLLFIGSIMAERFLYLPSVAFAGCLGLAIAAAAQRFSPGAIRPAATVAALICLAYAGRTWARNSDWTDELTLWTAAVKAAPASAKTHISVAVACLNLQPPDTEGAVAEAERALAILRPLPDERNVAIHYADAARAWRIAGNRASDAARKDTAYRKALAYALDARRIDQTVSAAIRRAPGGNRYALLGTADVYAELGRLQLLTGEPPKALETLEYARLLRTGAPEDEDSAALADARMALGQPRQAAVALLEGFVLHPAQDAFPTSALEVYREIDPQGCAAAKRGGLNTECPAVQQDLCAAAANVARLHRARGQPLPAAAVAAWAHTDFACPAGQF